MSREHDHEVQRRVARIEGLVQAIESWSDPDAQRAARDLAAALLDYHGAGLTRVLELLAEAGAPGRAVAEACKRDDLVASLFSLHDLPRPEPPLVQLRVPGAPPKVPEPPSPPLAPGEVRAPELTFAVRRASAVPDAVTPLVSLEIQVKNAAPGEVVQAILHCQVRIEPQRRGYTPAEQEALRNLFGDAGAPDRPPRPFLWARAVALVPAFAGETVVSVDLPFTYDLAVASARYFHALDEGVVPLLVLFSGTVFHPRADGALQAAPVPWSLEARHELPVSVWKEVMALHYPESAPLLLRRDVFENLHRYRASHALSTWEQALESLLPPRPAEPSP